MHIYITLKFFKWRYNIKVSCEFGAFDPKFFSLYNQKTYLIDNEQFKYRI